MSRIIVKNLPRIGVDEFKKYLNITDEITDFNFKTKSPEANVGYAFVGFRSSETAKCVVEEQKEAKIFNHKLNIDIAKDLHAIDRPKPLNKQTLKNSRVNKKIMNLEKFINNEKSKEEYFADLVRDLVNDEDFLNFLTFKSFNKNFSYKKRFDELIKKANKDKIERYNKLEKEKIKLLEHKEDSNDISKQVKQFFIKFKGLKTLKKHDVENFFMPLKVKDVIIPWRGKRINPNFIDVEFKSHEDQMQAMEKNNRYLLNTKVFLIPYEIENENNYINDYKNEKSLNAEQDMTIENGKLFFRNLPYDCTSEDVRNIFEKYGPLSDFSLKTYEDETSTLVNRGFGSCTFVFNDDAIKAAQEVDGTCVQGRIIHVLPGRQSDSNYEHSNDDNEINVNNFKALKEKKLKENASTNKGNWNSFFFTPDTVADILERKFATPKEQLLNPKQKDLPVTIALAETEIISETKTYLENQGIFLESFLNKKTHRSDTIILMKNLPINYQEKEIRETFYLNPNLIKRLIKAPNSSTCVIEFIDSQKSKFFFQKFAYYKIKDHVIYLEWAPLSVFSNIKPEKSIKKIENESTTLIVKNLAFQAQKSDLMQLFGSFGSIESIRLPQKTFVNSKNPNQTHKGFAFVQFSSDLDAQNAYKYLSISTHLYGRRLVLEFAQQDSDIDLSSKTLEYAHKKAKIMSEEIYLDFKKNLMNDIVDIKER